MWRLLLAISAILSGCPALAQTEELARQKCSAAAKMMEGAFQRVLTEQIASSLENTWICNYRMGDPRAAVGSAKFHLSISASAGPSAPDIYRGHILIDKQAVDLPNIGQMASYSVNNDNLYLRALGQRHYFEFSVSEYESPPPNLKLLPISNLMLSQTASFASQVVKQLD